MKKYKTSHINGSSKSFGSILISIMIFLLLSSTASALNVTNPPAEELVVGDLISISGNATSDIEVCTMFTVNEEVKHGEYEYVVDKVTVPSGTNTFAVEAETVNNLDITVKKGISLTFSATVVDGVASFYQPGVPPLTYKVTISGQSDEDSVNITMKAYSTIEVDGDGDFECTYDTSTVPAGDFIIVMEDDQGDRKQYNVTLLAKSPKSKVKSSSHTGTELRIITAEERAQASGDNGNDEVDEGDDSGEDEPEEQLESPVDEDEEPAQEDEIPVEGASGPQGTFFTKAFGWLKGLFS